MGVDADFLGRSPHGEIAGRHRNPLPDRASRCVRACGCRERFCSPICARTRFRARRSVIPPHLTRPSREMRSSATRAPESAPGSRYAFEAEPCARDHFAAMIAQAAVVCGCHRDVHWRRCTCRRATRRPTSPCDRLAQRHARRRRRGRARPYRQRGAQIRGRQVDGPTSSWRDDRARNASHDPSDRAPQAECAFEDTLDRLTTIWRYKTSATETTFSATMTPNVLETVLWLFSDAMGYFDKALTQAGLDERLALLRWSGPRWTTLPRRSSTTSHDESCFQRGIPTGKPTRPQTLTSMP